MSAGRVTVVGAGTMGHGIAYVAALSGFEVCLTDSRAEVLPLALGRLNDLLAVAAKRGKLAEPDRVAAAGRLRAEHEFAPAVASADVVIEAVHEHLGVKHMLCTLLETHDGVFTGRVIRPIWPTMFHSCERAWLISPSMLFEVSSNSAICSKLPSNLPTAPLRKVAQSLPTPA